MVGSYRAKQRKMLFSAAARTLSWWLVLIQSTRPLNSLDRSPVCWITEISISLSLLISASRGALILRVLEIYDSQQTHRMIWNTTYNQVPPTSSSSPRAPPQHQESCGNKYWSRMSAIGEWIHLILILMMIAAEPLTKATYMSPCQRKKRDLSSWEWNFVWFPSQWRCSPIDPE